MSRRFETVKYPRVGNRRSGPRVVIRVGGAVINGDRLPTPCSESKWRSMRSAQGRDLHLTFNGAMQMLFSRCGRD